LNPAPPSRYAEPKNYQSILWDEELLVKSTGVVRKIDELGRIVLPSELRRVFGIHEGDELEISVEGEHIILNKRLDVCLFCSSDKGLVLYKDRRVCSDCAGELARATPREVRLDEKVTAST
jgi:transcriptional pleiotropic regulator of transition state genes